MPDLRILLLRPLLEVLCHHVAAIRSSISITPDNVDQMFLVQRVSSVLSIRTSRMERLRSCERTFCGPSADPVKLLLSPPCLASVTGLDSMKMAMVRSRLRLSIEVYLAEVAYSESLHLVLRFYFTGC